jgi:ferric iron reductase protein FhuF
MVYADSDLSAGQQPAFDQMCLQNLMSKVFFHLITPPVLHLLLNGFIGEEIALQMHPAGIFILSRCY